MPKGKHIITISKSVLLYELHAFCIYEVLVSYAFVMRLFAAHLQHNKKVDNVELVPTNTY